MKGFDELLSETMDDTIKLALGESASELICRLVERQVMVKRGGVDEKIEAFYAFLERLLGSEVARVIQATNLRRFCLRLRREYEEVEEHFSFLDRLYEVKFRLLAPLLKEERSVCN